MKPIKQWLLNQLSDDMGQDERQQREVSKRYTAGYRLIMIGLMVIAFIWGISEEFMGKSPSLTPLTLGGIGLMMLFSAFFWIEKPVFVAEEVYSEEEYRQLISKIRKRGLLNAVTGAAILVVMKIIINRYTSFEVGIYNYVIYAIAQYLTTVSYYKKRIRLVTEQEMNEETTQHAD